MRKNIVTIFLVLTFLCSPANSEIITVTQEREKALLQRVTKLEEGNKRLIEKNQCTEKLQKEAQQVTDSITALDNAIKLQPDNARAYLERGDAYGDLGRYARAIKDYNEAIRLKPGDAIAYSFRGAAYHNLGQYARAIKDFSQAIRLQPDLSMAYIAYFRRGFAYAHLGQYINSRADYDEAIRLKPDDNDAYYHYACLFSLQKDAAQACSWLKLAIARGYKDWKHLKADKDFDNIRNEKCFVDIIKKIQTE